MAVTVRYCNVCTRVKSPLTGSGFHTGRRRRVNKEAAWRIKAAVVDSAELRERCTKRLARNVRKNAKSHSSPERTVRYIARTVSRSARMRDVKKRDIFNISLIAD